MNTKILLSASASFLAILGLIATFMPQETLDHFGAGAQGDFTLLAVQIAGTLYMGFAMMNWMARGSRIGGVYNRPVALGNFLHFLMGALLLLKSLGGDAGIESIVGLILYAAFAVGFGLVTFGCSN